MAVISDEVELNRADDQNDWTANGFDPPTNNNSASTTEIHREGGSCQEWVLKENININTGRVLTTVIPNNQDWDQLNMAVLVWWFFVTSDADFDKVTNFRLRVSSSTNNTSNYHAWNVAPQIEDPDRYGWVPIRVFNQNPDFTNGTFNDNDVESIGWWASTGSQGTKLTGFDQAILISKVIGHSGTVTLQNLKDEDTAGDWGVVENYGADFFKFNVSIELGSGGSPADTANAVFSVANKSIFFENIEPGHNLGWLFVDPSSTFQVHFTLDTCVVTWNSQDSSIAQAEIFGGAHDPEIFRVSNTSFARGGRCTLPAYVSDADTFFDSNTLNACDRADFGNCRALNNTFLAPSIGADEGAMLIDATFTALVAARQTGQSFTRGTAGHALELASGTPASITLNGYRFSGYNEVSTGDNLVANSGPADATIYNNSGGAVEIVITNGDAVLPSVRNGVGATTTIVAAVNITFTDFQADTEIRVYETGTSTEAFGVESATTPTEVAPLSAGTGYDIVAILPGFQPIRRENVSFSADQEFSLQQLIDRDFNNPP